jgi:5-methylthioadenosine/S-adenosylhomocysteine deaminase
MESLKSIDLLITNGMVLTMDADETVIEDAAVAVSGDSIVEVGKKEALAASYNAFKTIDAQGGIIMPGLVNTHTHAAMSLFRGLADDLPLWEWLSEHMFKVEARWLNPDSVRAGTLLSCAEMLLSGTTTCCDGYFFEDVVAQAMNESGMRAVVAQGIIDFPAPGVPDPAKNVDEAERFIGAWQGKNSLITPGLFCHSPYACSKATLRKARQVADGAGCLFQIHVAETKSEASEIEKKHGTSPVQYLDCVGVLNSETLLVHAIWVNEKDIACMAKRGVGVSVTTESEMKLASGIAPVESFLEHGISVGMGTDSCASNNNLDMFQEMDMTAKLHKVQKLDPTVLSARQVLRMATLGGAQAIGLGEQIGSLEVGKRADLIVVNTHKPHLTPLYDPVSHLVYSASGSDVSHVIVDGRPVVRDGALLTFDWEGAAKSVRSLAKKIASAA